jgi:DNA-directed RNA polymerase specialized sigma subunit
LLDLAVIDLFDKEAAKGKDLGETKKSELQLWQDWKKSGEDPDKLRPLLHSFRPLIRQRANVWANHVDLPPSAVHAEFNKQFVNSLRTYNPNKGAALGTWVTTNLRKAQRWVTTYQNPARIQEKRVYQVGAFQTAKSQLDDQLGREPTSFELANHLGWAEPEVSRMQSELRRALPSSGFETGYDPTKIMPSRELEVFNLVRYDLTPEELTVYEHRTGFGGKQQLRPGEIAKTLNRSPSYVSRVLGSIANKMDKHLK